MEEQSKIRGIIVTKRSLPDKFWAGEGIGPSVIVLSHASLLQVEMVEEPSDWKPSDKCYFCVEGEGGGEARPGGAAVSTS